MKIENLEEVKTAADAYLSTLGDGNPIAVAAAFATYMQSYRAAYNNFYRAAYTEAAWDA